VKILVIDDRPENLLSAREQLGDEHEVVTCQSYEVGNYLLRKGDSQNTREFLRTAEEEWGWEMPGYSWQEGWRKMMGSSYGDETEKEIAENDTPLPYWDMVLTDGMMPFDGYHRNHDWGEEKLVGYQLALLAIYEGAKYVAVVFSNHHHNNAEGSILEGNFYHCGEGFDFANGSKLVFHQDSVNANNSGSGKDWTEVVQELIK
jgi:CheY-like chemotaxis protein